MRVRRGLIRSARARGHRSDLSRSHGLRRAPTPSGGARVTPFCASCAPHWPARRKSRAVTSRLPAANHAPLLAIGSPKKTNSHKQAAENDPHSHKLPPRVYHVQWLLMNTQQKATLPLQIMNVLQGTLTQHPSVCDSYVSVLTNMGCNPKSTTTLKLQGIPFLHRLPLQTRLVFHP